MSDTTENTKPAEPQTASGEVPEPPAPENETPEATEELERDTKAGREAARYRRQLREAEANNAELSKRLDNMQHTFLYAIALQTMKDPTDLWTVGKHEMSEFVTEHGTIDTKAVNAAIHQLIKARPELSSLPYGGRTVIPGEGGGTPPAHPRSRGIEAGFMPKNQRD